MEPSPDFDRLRKALLCRKPDRIPLAELLIDRSIMEAFIGRSVGDHNTGEDYDLSAEIDFWFQAGYDNSFSSRFPALQRDKGSGDGRRIMHYSLCVGIE